ncbi:MAG: carboxypeptidase regulatory-like domain-containing protein [Cytophagales bacterium]
MKKALLFLIIGISIFTVSFQLITTQLKLTILNNLGKEEEGVRVRLFKSEADYKAEKNKVDEHYTDKRGVVSFKNLEPIPYYINAVKDNKNNYGNGELTDSLKEKEINKVKVIIQD